MKRQVQTLEVKQMQSPGHVYKTERKYPSEDKECKEPEQSLDDLLTDALAEVSRLSKTVTRLHSFITGDCDGESPERSMPQTLQGKPALTREYAADSHRQIQQIGTKLFGPSWNTPNN